MRTAGLNQELRSRGLRSGGRKPVTAAAARRRRQTCRRPG
jgi:hypothetical protein